jgi:hypothetical protein
MDDCCVTLDLCEPGTVATPGCNVGRSQKLGDVLSVCSSSRGSPRDATPCQLQCARRALRFVVGLRAMAILCREWKCVGCDHAHPSAKVSPTMMNCRGCASVGSALDAAPRRQALSAALCYPVSRPSSHCDLVLRVVVWGWLS